jgi:hypothetical protein
MTEEEEKEIPEITIEKIGNELPNSNPPLTAVV